MSEQKGKPSAARLRMIAEHKDRPFPPEKQKELEAAGLRWCPKRNRYVANIPGPCKPKEESTEQFEQMEHKSESGKTYRAVLSKFPEDKGQRKIVEIYDVTKGLLTSLDPQEHELLKQIFQSKISIEENKAQTMFTQLTTPTPPKPVTSELKWNAKLKKWE